jgi:hypothetical protein
VLSVNRKAENGWVECMPDAFARQEDYKSLVSIHLVVSRTEPAILVRSHKSRFSDRRSACVWRTIRTCFPTLWDGEYSHTAKFFPLLDPDLGKALEFVMRQSFSTSPVPSAALQ